MKCKFPGKVLNKLQKMSRSQNVTHSTETRKWQKNLSIHFKAVLFSKKIELNRNILIHWAGNVMVIDMHMFFGSNGNRPLWNKNIVTDSHFFLFFFLAEISFTRLDREGPQSTAVFRSFSRSPLRHPVGFVCHDYELEYKFSGVWANWFALKSFSLPSFKQTACPIV